MEFLYILPAPMLLVIALVVTIGASLCAQSLIHRKFSSEAFVHHNEVGGIIIVVVASLYAVLLGFMTVVAWEQVQETRTVVVSEAGASIDAWHTSVGLPPAVRQRVRRDMTRYAETMVLREWPAMKHGGTTSGAAMLIMDAMDATGGFAPNGFRDSNAQASTMQQLGTMHDARQRRIASNESELSGFEWIVLLLGAAIITAFCWLFGGTRPVIQMIMTATVVATLTATLVLLFELQSPFRSGMGINDSAWAGALEHIHEMMHGSMSDMRG